MFVRDCQNCTVVAACGQFRTRDCQKIIAFLCCNSQPIIEATKGFKIGCFQYFYSSLEVHFQNAGLSPFNNLWHNVHDFTPDNEGNANVQILGEMFKVADYLPLPTTAASDLAISTDKQSSVVPLTVKPWRKDTQGLETSLAVVFGDDNYQRLKSELFLSKVPETVELLDAKQVKYDGPISSHFKQYPESGLVKHQAYCNTFYVSLTYYRQSTWLTMVITVFGQRLCRTDQISQTPGPRRPLKNGCWFERHCQYNLRLRFCRKSATRGENHQQLCRNVSVNVNLNQ